MRFLVDAQLPLALARMLSDHGHVAEHVTDVGPADAADHDLWRYALENRAVIITKDEDFSSMRVLASGAPAIVWVRTGITRRAALIEWFEPLLDKVVELIESGDDFIELR